MRLASNTDSSPEPGEAVCQIARLRCESGETAHSWATD